MYDFCVISALTNTTMYHTLLYGDPFDHLYTYASSVLTVTLSYSYASIKGVKDVPHDRTNSDIQSHAIHGFWLTESRTFYTVVGKDNEMA